MVRASQFRGNATKCHDLLSNDNQVHVNKDIAQIANSYHLNNLIFKSYKNYLMLRSIQN